MATFLELVRDLARDSGTLAGGVSLASVVEATGRAEKMVSWVRKAWVNIQNERADWPWMKREFQAPLTIGKSRYTAADLGIVTRFGQWIGDQPRAGGRWFRTFTVYDPATGQADENTLREIEYDVWRERYARGAHDANRPTEWAVSNIKEWCIGNRPDKPYLVSGEYRLAPQILTGNTDVPEMPEEYHGAIVLEAMKLLGMADESPATSGAAISEYVLARQNLNRDYLPEILWGGRAIA